MAKPKTSYVCNHCGANSAKWLGKCNDCEQWNTFEEVVQIDAPKAKKLSGLQQEHQAPISIQEILPQQKNRIDSKDTELNKVLGGGLVPGSVVLIGGEPGIGKSTLILQMALKMTGQKILYVSGEESAEQIKMRAERLEGSNPSCFIHCETQLEIILSTIDQTKPDVVIIDSIQTIGSGQIESSSGGVTQIRECTYALQQVAKQKGLPIILIGHINKEGGFAGPKLLEHLVDTVLYFEGDQQHLFRILRTVKNRYGSTSELGIYEMTGAGLSIVENPSELLLTKRDDSVSGICVGASMNGMKSFLVEIQALVSNAVFSTPQRIATGFDNKRLNLLLAVLEKRAGLNMAGKDVFINVAGGIKVTDPAMDMSIISAVISSRTDMAIDNKACCAAEVSLSGELRPVSKIDQRILEAEKLGFTTMFIAASSRITATSKKMKIIKVNTVQELMKKLFIS